MKKTKGGLNLKTLNTLKGIYLKVLNTILVVLTLSIPLLMFFQVVLRYVFRAPLMGIEELITFPTIWLYMLGAVAASISHTHIECGVLTVYIKKPITLAVVNIIKAAISFVVSIWCSYWGLWLLNYSYDKWKISDMLHIPMFYGESAYGIGLILLTIYCFIDLVVAIKETAATAKFSASMTDK